MANEYLKDPKAAGPPESDDPDEALIRQLRARQRRRRVIMFGLLGVLALAPCSPMALRWYENYQERQANRLAPDEEAELPRLAERLEATAARRESAWNAAARRELLDRVRPGASPCGVTLHPPTPQAAQSYVQHGSIDGNYFGSWSLRMVRPGEALGVSGDAAMLRWYAKDIRERIASGSADKDTLAWARRRAEDAGRADRTVIVLVDEERKPVGLGEKFIPGSVRGRAFLYNAAAGSFVCGAAFEAANSSNVQTRYSYMKGNFLDESYKASAALGAALGRDLEVQVRAAIADGLRVLETSGPGGSPEAAPGGVGDGVADEE